MTNSKSSMYAVIMAGGQGTRLWPLSRKENPKQLQTIAGDKPMIRETYERLLLKFKPEEIIISTTPDFNEKIKAVLPEISEENFIIEPFPMGTAAACGLVTKILNLRNPESVAIFLPSDHVIQQKEKFIETVNFAEKMVEKYPKQLVLIGINPTKPDVNLGYIQMEKQVESENGMDAFSVKGFVEKPDLKTAEEYLQSWEYLWNAGIFTWRTDYMLELMQKNLLETFASLEKIGEHVGKEDEKEVLNTEYAKVENTSIDYGIMEKTKDILVIPADFGWNDIGSWGALLDVLKEMHATDVIADGHHLNIDSSNVLVKGNSKLIATIGLKDIAIIDTPDAMLICNAKESHKVKDLLNKIKEEKKEQYL